MFPVVQNNFAGIPWIGTWQDATGIIITKQNVGNRLSRFLPDQYHQDAPAWMSNPVIRRGLPSVNTRITGSRKAATRASHLIFGQGQITDISRLSA
jgi:hypothetical protein